MNMSCITSVLFLRKNHTFCHPTRGLNIKKQKYGLTPGSNQAKMFTLSHTDASASEPCHSRERKK
jgi:hypothetical protein